MGNTTTPVISKELASRMRMPWILFRVSAAALFPEELERPTPAGWTYQAMLAHVAAWHELAARRIDAFRETGRREPPAGADAERLYADLGLRAGDREALGRAWDMDRFNAAIAAAAAGRPPTEVLAGLDASFGRITEAVGALSDEQAAAHVEDGKSFVEAVVAGNTIEHYAEHRPELAAALPATGAALAARVDGEWRRFREAVRNVGRAGLAGTTPTGWTRKDLVAHVIGWLQDVPGRIEATRAGTNRPLSGQRETDEFNARSIASRALVGPEALLDELDTSYRRVHGAIAALSDDEAADPRFLGLVVTRTYAHWRGHESELR